ncbi:DUF1232 domain-containing protein [Heyndrickxia acidicola]|uniref:DUF1232 domain-containing protein n=1 Tax=Heyndrickxia acidicola TaxID=209389 RepID=A0ABU6MH54_9BACI|nr:DUF1232 domain-containing protein [Heyndrickxia acidicola]MED1203624.1 DUF1232 domain-containing protein [Heyndrickxia acidicola]
MSEKNHAKDLGFLLKGLLKEKSLSMRKLSVLTEIDIATISRIINGKQQAKLNHLQQFSLHLSIPLEKLIQAAGYDIGGKQEEVPSDIHYSFDMIQEILKSYKLVDTTFTISRIQQELAKYEQYAKTEEGHQLICRDFQTKLEQVGNAGPFIEQLRDLYMKYCDEVTLLHERTILGSALLYFILSTDIIPDYVFPIGYLDDAIAVQLVINRLAK